MTGTIKTVNSERGFGFLKPENGSDDVFFHMSAVQPKGTFATLGVGQRVNYEEEDGPKGPRAGRVTLVAGA